MGPCEPEGESIAKAWEEACVTDPCDNWTCVMVTVVVFGRAALALSGRGAMRNYITRPSIRLNSAKPSSPRRAFRRLPSPFFYQDRLVPPT